mgnify:CR=1 FL=1
MLNFIIFLIFGFIAGYLLTGWSIRISEKHRIHDVPGSRSSHKIPTPRLGGAGIFSAVIILYLISLLSQPFTNYAHAGVLIVPVLSGAAICFAFGLVDDMRGLGAGVKFLMQGVSALIPVLAGYRIISVARFAGLTPGPVTGGILAFCWILLMINAFNFMDGMNGKAGTFAAVAAVFMASIVGKGTPDPVVFFLAILSGACTGFLIYNLTPARTFMGDSGSQFLGYILAVIPIYLQTSDPVRYPFGAFVLLLFPFLYDVLFTLIRRLFRGENIFRAHRSHLYQRLLIAGWTHPGVLRLVFITYVLCGIFGMLFAGTGNTQIRIISAIAALAVMIGYHLFVICMEKRSI